MTQIEIEKEITDLNDQIKQSNVEKQILATKLKLLTTLSNDLNDLKERDSELPPGFKIYWFHRHDPFESVWALSLHGKYDFMANDTYGEQTQKVELRKRAWSLWDLACKVLGPVITDENGKLKI
jgi:predicted nuclease with TOPRIM domain